MRSSRYVVPGVVLALAVVPVAAAKKPGTPPPAPKGAAAVTLAAKPAIVVFGGPTTLSGRLSGPAVAGVAVRLEQDATRPYGDGYKNAGASAVTGANGAYSLAVKPLVNTQFRVVAQASPPVTSPPRLVVVRTLVGLRISDRTPRRGSLVRFSGSVFPAHDGRPALIQKRTPSGRFTTVARTALRDAGTDRSTYNRRVRAVTDGVYRVKVPSDADHVNGFSRRLAVDVHG